MLQFQPNMQPEPDSLAFLQCALFNGVSRSDLDLWLSTRSFTVARYAKGEILAFEEDECRALGIVIEGKLHIQRLYPNGKAVILETIQAGGSFGEAVLFSDQGVYPATVIAAEDSQVVFIPKEDVLELLPISAAFMGNMLKSLSNRILLLNRRIKGLSVGSVRQKVANYLLEEAGRQNTQHINLHWGREQFAEALGIPRPSLSRELVLLKEEGWIDFQGRSITILDRAALVMCLEG